MKKKVILKAPPKLSRAERKILSGILQKARAHKAFKAAQQIPVEKKAATNSK